MNSFIKREYDYAVRICAYMAGQPSGTTVSVSKISKALFITRPFSNKIINQLRLAGITGSVQGKFGGVFLRKKPEQLSILDILKAMNFNSTINECILNPGICPLIKSCKIHLFFKEQEELLLKNFEQKKIIDFAFSDKDILNSAKPIQPIT